MRRNRQTNNQNSGRPDSRLSGMIGLAAKAGKVAAGEFSCEKSIASRKAGLCILAADASENTRKHFSDMCSFRDIPLITGSAGKDELGHMIGKKERAVITIESREFSKSILTIFEGGITNGE